MNSTAQEQSKIFVAGHNGMVGSAIIRQLHQSGDSRLILKSRQDLDLANQEAVRSFFDETRPDQVYMAAAKVGGIYANNNFPAEFIYNNLIIGANIIEASFRFGVKKLLFLGSSCIYPKHASQPMDESELLSGYLEPTNEPYAIAKIAGIKMCEGFNRQYGASHGIDYRSIMPTNLYGPGDNYHNKNAHVIPALIRRFHEAKLLGSPAVKIWGTGKPRREFMFVDDLAAAAVHVMNLPLEVYCEHTQEMSSHINVGCGYDFSIREVAELIRDCVGYQGDVQFDHSKPDGSPRKLMDSNKINRLGWFPKFELVEGLRIAYDDFTKNYKSMREK